MKTDRRRPRNLAYTPHLVTYLDILGFRDLIAEESPNLISRAIRKVIEATAPKHPDAKRFKENYVNFSDLIVHTVPVNSKANVRTRIGLVYGRVVDLLEAQVALIQEGLLVRGALTLGPMERSYKVLFGPGLIEAYDLERTKARFPRIVLDPFLLRELKTNPILRRHRYREEMRFLSPLLKTDEDGYVFIDYLRGLRGERESSDYFRFLKIHRDLVTRGLAEFRRDRDVLPKYGWLKRYHNEAVTALIPEDIRTRYLIRT